MTHDQVWMLFFTTVVGWQYHPGVKNPMNLAQCGVVADAMLSEFVWRFGQPPQPSAET